MELTGFFALFEENVMKQRVILSGIRPTGILHLGNLLGAMRHFVELAKDPKNFCMYFIANQHAQTTGMDPVSAAEMQKELLGIVLDFMACGLDPNSDNVLLYAQSSIPETSELAWMLSCVATVSELMGMHHFAEKREALKTGSDTASTGLLTYPVLMAADILGPNAHLVPVGADQHEHVELARSLARRFNNRFGVEHFRIPELLEGPGIRVPGLKGQGKMGKSEPKGTLSLHDSPDLIRTKIKKADKRLPDNLSTGEKSIEPRIEDQPGIPEKCRVYLLHALACNSAAEEMEIQFGCRRGTLRCGDCKHMLANRIVDMLTPIQERRRELNAQGGEKLALEILHEHGKRARAIIAPNVQAIKELTGIPTY